MASWIAAVVVLVAVGAICVMLLLSIYYIVSLLLDNREADRANLRRPQREPFLCFYGIHSWYIDHEVFSRSRRCVRCPIADDVFAHCRLLYERQLWNGDLMTRNADPDAARQYVQAKLLEWDRDNHFFQVDALD